MNKFSKNVLRQTVVIITLFLSIYTTEAFAQKKVELGINLGYGMQANSPFFGSIKENIYPRLTTTKKTNLTVPYPLEYIALTNAIIVTPKAKYSLNEKSFLELNWSLIGVKYYLYGANYDFNFKHWVPAGKDNWTRSFGDLLLTHDIPLIYNRQVLGKEKLRINLGIGASTQLSVNNKNVRQRGFTHYVYAKATDTYIQAIESEITFPVKENKFNKTPVFGVFQTSITYQTPRKGFFELNLRYSTPIVNYNLARMDRIEAQSVMYNVDIDKDGKWYKSEVNYTSSISYLTLLRPLITFSISYFPENWLIQKKVDQK